MAAPCIQMSRAGGRHAPGRRLAEQAKLPKAGGGWTHPTLSALLINLPAVVVGLGRDTRGEARSNTSDEEPQGREEEFLH